MDILIVGVSARALAESAIRTGLAHRIVAADYFGDFDLGTLCPHRSIKRDLRLPYEARHLIAASADLPFDVLIYTANLENYPSVIEAIAGGRPILGNSPAVLTSVRDPARLLGVLTQAGIPTPKIAFDADYSDPHPDTVWLRKPLRGGGGHGIAVHRSEDRLERGVFLQEYLDGVSCAAVFAADGSEARLLGISEQLIGRTEFGADGFRYCGSILGPIGAGWSEWSDLDDRVNQVVGAITRAFHLVGVNGIDFILKGQTVYPIEVNPRYTASMELVERAYGLNIFRTHLDACLGRLPDFDLLAHYDVGYFGKAVHCASRALIFHNPQWWFEQGIRDLPHEREQIAPGKPVCTLFSRGQSRSECYNQLVDLSGAIEQTYPDATTTV